MEKSSDGKKVMEGLKVPKWVYGEKQQIVLEMKRKMKWRY
jgi:hypothetical protein